MVAEVLPVDATKVFQDGLAAGGDNIRFLKVPGVTPLEGGFPAPAFGDVFFVVDNEKLARDRAVATQRQADTVGQSHDFTRGDGDGAVLGQRSEQPVGLSRVGDADVDGLDERRGRLRVGARRARRLQQVAAGRLVDRPERPEQEPAVQPQQGEV